MRNFFIGILLLIPIYFVWNFAIRPNPQLSAPTIIDIPPGSDFHALLSQLHAQGIDLPPLQSKIASRLLHIDRKIHHGEFMLTPPLSSLAILRELSSGHFFLRKLLVKEGFNTWDIANAWTTLYPQIKSEDLIAIFHDPELLQKAHVPAEIAKPFQSLEGYLFPNTYMIGKYDNPKVIVTRMIEEFDLHSRSILSEHPWAQTPMGLFRLLTLASIVEKESGAASEQPIIASVFWNRLNKKMRLQSDPTTIYGLMPNYSGSLHRVDLEGVTPYNTYRINELPAGPISNPSMTALKAVVHPATTDYLYFVSKGDGTHVFSKTFEEHNKNVKKYQLGQ